MLYVDNKLIEPVAMSQVSTRFPELSNCLVPPQRFHVTLLALAADEERLSGEDEGMLLHRAFESFKSCSGLASAW